MPDEPTTESTEPTEPTEPPSVEPTEPTEPTEPAEPTEPENTETTLPEWAQGELKRARTEAGSYRTRLRAVEAELEKAKTVEEFEDVKSSLSTRISELEHELLVSTVARAHGLPDDLAARLRGSTQEELVADAKQLAQYVPARPAADLSGGLDPSTQAGPSADPKELAELYGRGRRRA